MLEGILIVLLFAFSGAVKGGFLALDPPGSNKNFKARAQWALVNAAAVATLEPLAAPIALALVFAAGNLPRSSWDFLADPNRRVTLEAVGKAAGYGVLQYAAPLVAIAVICLDPLVVAWAGMGLLQPALYLLARTLPQRWGPWLRGTQFVDNWTRWGELATHAAMGLALVLATA